MFYRLTESFWKFFTRHQTPSPSYLHFICCTVMQRIREAVTVKSTLKSLRDKFPKRPVLTRHSIPERHIGDRKEIFFPYMWVHHPCARHVCMCIYVSIGQEKTTRTRDSEFRSVLCQLRYTVHGTTHVTDAILVDIIFHRLCVLLKKCAELRDMHGT